MKRTSGYIVIVILVLAVLVGTTTSCRPSKRAGAGDVAYYTCTMHPSVKSQDPKAKCPICGMDLVPVKRKSAPDALEGHDHATHMPSMPSMPGMPMEPGATNAPETPTEFTVP